MTLLDWKRGGATLLAVINLVLLVWALFIYRRKGSLPEGYYRLLPVSPSVAAFQVVLGVTLYGNGVQPPGMHVFYGILVACGTIGQLTLWRTTSLGHRFRARPLIHAFLGLFVMLLALRSWMAAG